MAPAKPRSNASFCQNVSKGVEGSRSCLSWIDLMEKGLIFGDQVGTLEVHVPFLVGQHRKLIFSSS